MIGIYEIEETAVTVDNLLGQFQFFQLVPLEEIPIPEEKIISFAKSTLKNVKEYDQIYDTLVRAIMKKYPSISRKEAENLVLEIDM